MTKRAALVLQWSRDRGRQRTAAATRARWQEQCRLQKQRRQLERAVLMGAVAFSFPAPRREITRAEGGWRGSTLHGYLDHGDDIQYKLKFRVTRDTLEYITEKLCSSGYVKEVEFRSRSTARPRRGSRGSREEARKTIV